jgi:O-antigen/teichoic acid export membrane protein
MNQLGRTVARNSLFGFTAQITIKLLSFAFAIVIVRNLGAEAFGQYSAVLAFGAVFVFLADLGLSPYTVRELAHRRDAADGPNRASALYGNLLLLRFVLSLLTALVIVSAAILTQRPPAMIGGVALGTLGLIMYSVPGAGEAVLSGFERIDIASVARVAGQLVFVTAGGAGLFLGFGYYGLIVANLLGISLMALYAWHAVRRIGVRPSPPDLRKCLLLIPRTLPLTVGGLALGLSYYYDSILLNITRGDAETGYYAAAYNLVFSAMVISNALSAALYPSLTRATANAPERLLVVLQRPLRFLLMIALPITVGTSVLAGQLVPLLYRSSYAQAVPALQIIIWVLPFMYVSNLLGYVVLIQWKERKGSRSVLISSALNVAVNSLLVPSLGLVAAAVMTVITEVVLVAQFAWILYPLMRKIDWGSALLRPLLASALMGVAVLVAHDLPLGVLVGLGVVTYVSFLLALRAIGRNDLHFLLSLRRANAEELMTTSQSAAST